MLLSLGPLAPVRGDEECDHELESTTPATVVTSSVIPWHFTAPATSAAPVAPVKAEFNIWRSLGSLIIVLGCLLAGTWFLKKRAFRMGVIGGNRRMQVIERLNLGQRQCLALIRIDGGDMLVGISPERITELGFTRKSGTGQTATQSYATNRDAAADKS